MQCVPCELWPSSLLWRGDAGAFVEALRKECNPTSALLSPEALEAWYKRAGDLLAQSRDDSALMLIYLADQYRESDMPERALECSQKAERHLTGWGKEEYRHNHAVAQYALGLALENSAMTMEAMHPYREAVKGLSAVRAWWITKNNPGWQQRCEEAIRWIKQRMQRLADTGLPGNWVPVSVVGRIAAGDPLLVDQPFDEWVWVDADRARRVNFALRVKGDSMIEAGIAPGDLVLIEQNQSVPTDGEIVAVYVERVDAEATLKKCYTETNHYRLEPANKKYPFRILKARSADEKQLRARYEKSYPGRQIEFYSDLQPTVVGWMRGVVRPTGP